MEKGVNLVQDQWLFVIRCYDKRFNMSKYLDGYHAQSVLFMFMQEADRAQRKYENFLQNELTKCGIFNLAPAHFQILLAITPGGSTIGNLAADSGVSGSLLSYYLTHLEKYDYIQREKLHDDLRFLFVKQTKKARTLIGNLTRSATRRVEATWKELGDNDKNALHDVLVKVSHSLKGA